MTTSRWAWSAAGARLCVVALMTLAAGASLGGCDRDGGPPPSTRLAEPADAIDQALMVALGQAKNFHHKAKVYMGEGNAVEAIAAVRQILALRFPTGAPEAEDVRLDARALLAKLLIGQGQLDEAARTIDEGLAQSTRPSFFVANLHSVMGEVHEARAAEADASTDPAVHARGAEERREAIRAYDRSIEINRALQQRLMEERP
jgi:tetratricopeptide (TPR) repeat protein